jgi:hypothetical protein
MSLDLAQNEDQLNMPLIWNILLMVQVISVWVVYPILIVYYESNENDGLVSVLYARVTLIEEEDLAVHASSRADVHRADPGDSADLLLAQRCKAVKVTLYST